MSKVTDIGVVEILVILKYRREQGTENGTKSRTFFGVVFGAWRFKEYVQVFSSSSAILGVKN